MHIVRFADASGNVHVGLSDGVAVRKIPWVSRMADLLRLELGELRDFIGPVATEPPVDGEVRLLPPVDGHTEVWAAGVTYARSKDARMEESSEQSVYDRVYGAERPELFFKAVPWRVVTDGEAIAIREDSPLNVPEPELAVVVNSSGEIAGYTVCDDVSSRSIEGENPLYLPQAKVYAGSCALAAGIRPAWELTGHRDLDITLEVHRGEGVCFQGQVNTSAIHRELDVLVEHLFRSQPFPDGAVLATGTGIVPDLDFTLVRGDLVRIEVPGVGTLTNPVTSGQSELDWLVEAIDHPLSRKKAR